MPIYSDAPYTNVGHELYRHYLSPDGHRQLAAALQTCRKALVTYDDSEEIRSMFNGSEIDQLSVNYSADRNCRNNYGDKRREELIISCGDFVL
jgi:hypothetical protein